MNRTHLLLCLLLLSIGLYGQEISAFEKHFNIVFDTTFLSEWKLAKSKENQLVFKNKGYAIHVHGQTKTSSYFYPNIQSSIFVNNLMQNEEGGTSVFSIPSDTCQAMAGADWCVEYYTQPKKQVANYEHCKVLAFYTEQREALIFCVIFFNNPDITNTILTPKIFTYAPD